MAFEGGFLRPAPESEPPLRPCPGGRAEQAPPSPSCRNSVTSNAVSRRPGTIGLQRIIRASHPAKSCHSVEVDAAARQFATAVVRVALEVLDGRRSVVQLRPLAVSTVVEAVRTVVNARLVPGLELGVAVLTRVDVIMSGPAAAEVCAGYDRGARHFALAAHIVRGPSGWRLTAFRVR
ncbi:Rv3235 family protein [Nocardia sp. NPDC127526]|uniref:Rv3235 family protein n=1 Tax=Nocardia sp. NPDC127526 TaxID=3345393 RepID=UPI003633CAD2